MRPNAARRQPRSAQVDQQRPLSRAFRFAQHLLARREIRLHRLFRRIAKRNIPLLASLAAHQDDLVRPADVVEVDADELRVANAAAIEQFQDRLVALSECRTLRHFRIEYRIDLFDRRHARQFLRQLWRGHQRRRVLLDLALLRQPLVQRPQRRQCARHRGLAQPALVQARQVAADQHMVNVAPTLRPNIFGELLPDPCDRP